MNGSAFDWQIKGEQNLGKIFPKLKGKFIIYDNQPGAKEIITMDFNDFYNFYYKKGIGSVNFLAQIKKDDILILNKNVNAAPIFPQKR